MPNKGTFACAASPVEGLLSTSLVAVSAVFAGVPNVNGVDGVDAAGLVGVANENGVEAEGAGSADFVGVLKEKGVVEPMAGLSTDCDELGKLKGEDAEAGIVAAGAASFLCLLTSLAASEVAEGVCIRQKTKAGLRIAPHFQGTRWQGGPAREDAPGLRWTRVQSEGRPGRGQQRTQTSKRSGTGGETHPELAR